MTNPKAAPAPEPDVECRNCWQPKRTHSRMDGNGILYCHDGISSWNPPATAPAPDMKPTEVETLKLEVERLNCLLNTPETDDFYRGIELEAAHQRLRWPPEHDPLATLAASPAPEEIFAMKLPPECSAWWRAAGQWHKELQEAREEIAKLKATLARFGHGDYPAAVSEEVTEGMVTVDTDALRNAGILVESVAPNLSPLAAFEQVDRWAGRECEYRINYVPDSDYLKLLAYAKGLQEQLGGMTKNCDQWERNSAAENRRAGDAMVKIRRLEEQIDRLKGGK